jgi:hypothetical protein
MNWQQFVDPRFLIALLVIAIFGWAYGSNTGDQTMIGALIGAFNLAIGYYLGSSSSNREVREQVSMAQRQTDRALDIAAGQQGVETLNVDAQEVNVERKP